MTVQKRHVAHCWQRNKQGTCFQTSAELTDKDPLPFNKTHSYQLVLKGCQEPAKYRNKEQPLRSGVDISFLGLTLTLWKLCLQLKLLKASKAPL